MTEKRYYAHKHLLQENKVHDKICHNFMNIDETVEHMNNQYWKYKQLKEESEQLKKDVEFWKQVASQYSNELNVFNHCKKYKTGVVDKKKLKKIDELMKENSNYGYYYEPSILKKLKPDFRRGVNCSDIDEAEEQIKQYRKEYFKKHIIRKATPEELEWIKKQPKVDLDDPKHEHLKQICAKLIEERWFE